MQVRSQSSNSPKTMANNAQDCAPRACRAILISSLIATLLLLSPISSFPADANDQSPQPPPPAPPSQTNAGEHQSAPSASPSHSRPAHPNVCPKQWIHLGHKCYKINHTPRNYEGAKGRCHDLLAKLAIVEDHEATAREKEASVVPGTSASNPHEVNILTYLESDQRRQEFQTRHYYVNLSSDLLSQYHNNGLNPDAANGGDAYDSDAVISELWLQRSDPSVAPLVLNLGEKPDPNVAFVLVFSRTLNKWGLAPVSPTRKMSFLCERPANSPTASNQSSHHSHMGHPTVASPTHHHTLEPRRNPGDTSGHHQGHHSGSPPSQTSTAENNSRSTEKEPASSASAPAATVADTSSMLFREFPLDKSIVMGSTVEMRCSAIESESTLNWTFNGRNLSQTNRVKVLPSGMLRIEHVRNMDGGNYTCTINSGSMSESKTARLEIIERPHQPEYVNAELLDKLSPSVRIKWTPGFNGNSPIESYIVEMRTVNTDSIEGDLNSIVQSNQWEVARANISADQTSVIIADLKPARKYIFRVKATNRVGISDPSLPTRHSIEVPVQPPSMAPENLSGTPKTSTSISIQWAPPPADSQNGIIKGYKIRHKLAGYASESNWYMNDFPDATHLSYVLDDLIVWQNYEIQVAAENDKGVGPYSASIFVRTKEGRPDKGPQSVAAEALTSNIVKVTWLPPPAQHINGLNQGYKAQAWFDAQHTQIAKELVVQHNTVSPFHSTNLDGLLPYTDYHITVKCFTNAGDGPPQTESVIVKTKQDFPEAVPTLEFADVLDKSLRLIWKPPRRINGELEHYTLEYSESATPDKKIFKKFPANINEARIHDLTPQTSYVFKIYPHTGVGPGPERVNRTITSVPPVLPESPTNLVPSNVAPQTVTIHFNPGFDGNASIEKWVVEALTPSPRSEYAPRWQNIYVSTDHTQGTNQVTVRNLRPFTRYKLRLTPVNVVGQARYPSESTTEFTTAQVEPEQPPRDFMIEDVKSNSVVARWSPLANSLWLGHPRGYNLTWSETNNSTTMFQLINDARGDTLHIRDLEEFTEYSFRIHAINDAGMSPSSEPITITTLEDVPSAAPANITAHATSAKSLTLDWNPVPKRHRNGVIRGYKIQYRAAKADAPVQHKTIDDNSTRHIILTDLKAYTTYHLALAAFTGVGDGVYSNVLVAQTLEDTPGVPQNVSYLSLSQTAVRILWDPPEDMNGEIIGYKVAYNPLGSKESVSPPELPQNDRTFKATNLKPDTHYIFTVTAKTKEGWGQQASVLLYTHDSELRSNLPFFRESWFVILCACISVVITIIITALLFVQTKSHKYRQDVIKSSTSQDRFGDAGFTIDDVVNGHYNNGFGLLSNATANHRRSNGALSQNTANFTLPKSPPRPHPGSVVYSDDNAGDDDVFEDIVDKQAVSSKSVAATSHYDSSSDSVTEKPSEISSSTAPDSDGSNDEGGDDYVNMSNRNFVSHYANVNGNLKGQRTPWRKGPRNYNNGAGPSTSTSSNSQFNTRTRPKLPQRRPPSVPKVPGDPSSSGSDNVPNAHAEPRPSTSGFSQITFGAELNGMASSSGQPQVPPQPTVRSASSQPLDSTDGGSANTHPKDVEANDNRINELAQSGGSSTNPNGTNNLAQTDLLNNHIVSLNGGRIIVDNMAGSRAPLPGFTSFV